MTPDPLAFEVIVIGGGLSGGLPAAASPASSAGRVNITS